MTLLLLKKKKKTSKIHFKHLSDQQKEKFNKILTKENKSRNIKKKNNNNNKIITKGNWKDKTQ
jgi:hypothetical protein